MYLDHGLNVLVMGDVMLDVYIFGTVSRISPEAPVPIVEVERPEMMTLGGAGNVALNLAGLKVKTHLFGVVGDDRDGYLIDKMAVDRGIHSAIYFDEKIHTTVKTRIIANDQQLLRFDKERILNGHDVDIKLGRMETILETKSINVVVMSDYDKGFLDPALISKTIQICKEKEINVLVDPKRGDWSAFKGADLIKPNLHELGKMAGCKLDKDDDIEKAARDAMDKYNLGAVLVTMGARGMMLITKENNEIISNTAKEVYDVSGAGDTVIAVLAACLGSFYGFIEAAKLANIAAGVVVGKMGTSPIIFEELT